jgi:hypothetical protein
MAWTSNTTFKTSEAVGHKTAKEAISRAVDKHKEKMSAVVGDAKKLADEQRRTLNSIKDPGLKRSAAR